MLWLTALSIPEMNLLINAIFACFIAGTIAIGATPEPVLFLCTSYKSLSLPIGSCQFFWHNYVVNTDCFMIILGLISLFAIKKGA